MKRIFESEKETDLLINEFTKNTGVKIGKLFNNAVTCWFLPAVKTLSVEANYLLQQEANGLLDQWTIKQCVSRGITWLGKYPVENCDLLRSILLHYTCTPWDVKQEGHANEYVKEMMETVKRKIRETESDYSPIHPCLGNFGEDICDRWETLWKEKIVYDVISAIVYVEEPQKPITWYEAIIFLKNIEILANEKYGVK